MSTDQMVHELFQNLEKTIHERLQVIEEVIRSKGIGGRAASNVLDNLSYRVGMLEAERSGATPAVHVHREEAPVKSSDVNVVEPSSPSTLFINAMKDLEITFRNVQNQMPEDDEEEEEEAEEAEEEEEEEAEEAEEEEAEGEVQEEEVQEEEAEEEEAQEEEAQEEEAQEEEEGLEEFTYKTRTFYRDNSTNFVYIANESGEPEHVGRWDPDRSRVLFKPT
jgi:cobalamin biosynthesis protein CobT